MNHLQSLWTNMATNEKDVTTLCDAFKMFCTSLHKPQIVKITDTWWMMVGDEATAAQYKKFEAMVEKHTKTH